MVKGIDVSENNSYIPWDALQELGVKFCFVRSSYGKSGQDEMFAENVKQAHAHGMLVGAYHYSYALTPDDAVKEATNCRDVIDRAGCLLELPVFFDMEDADHWKENHNFWFDQGNVTAICKAFLDHIGLDCGVYASLDWLENYIDWRSLGCAVWNAEWGNEDSIKGYCWQFTDNFAGMNIDGDFMYADQLFE